MDDLKFFLAIAEQNNNAMREAEQRGENTCTVTDYKGDSLTKYYHSRRWNDRPATIAEYKGGL